MNETAPWFDPATGVRPVPLADGRPTDSIHRESGCIGVDPAPAATTGGGGGIDIPIVDVLSSIALLIVIAVVAVLLIGLLRHYQPGATRPHRRRTPDDDLAPDDQTIARMELLPAAVRRTDVDLRAETQRLHRAGQFDRAVMTLLAHQLVLLDRRGNLRLHRGKTDLG